MIQTPVDLTSWSVFDEASLPFFFNRVSESFHLQLHRHDFMELAYVAEGSGFHYIDECILPVAKGDWFIVPLGTSHVFRPTSTGPSHPLIVYNCIFQPDRLAAELSFMPSAASLTHAMRLLQLTPDSEHGWHQLKDRDGQYGDWFRLAEREYMQRKPGFVPRLYGLFIELAVMLERQLAGDAGKSADHSFAASDSLDEAIRYIDRLIMEPITASTIASAFQMSERHFHRVFKRQMGMTFTTYIQNKRIEKSCRLLLTTQLPIQDIAQQVGYQDKKFFLSVFKKKTGLAPRDYRRQNGQS
ncbi:AraC family transcriptional regulator [Paenibacillus mendelii]|uniref:Helix-turn-helix domain-containing protein n=1 Tax=Paenibacillus mendelii TaxID=206163 RepID=A0ABV6JGC1_9BACL|nr:AraC family transcriptional regulator [Paenibacillus mendelii]MCQ6557730.1 AraC family transcriptional regulator [Paenibacillus mendelii]